MMKKAYCATMTWEQVRTHILLVDDSDRGRLIDLDTCRAILSRRTEKLSKRLLRELSILLHGYSIGESVGREQSVTKKLSKGRQ